MTRATIFKIGYPKNMLDAAFNSDYYSKLIEGVTDEELLERIRVLFQKIPHEYASVLKQRYLYGLTYREIAVVAGKGIDYARNTLDKAYSYIRHPAMTLILRGENQDVK